jgi:4-carboxymuconolactone decarboxylase
MARARRLATSKGNRMTEYNDDREKAGLKIIEQLGWGQNEGVRELDEDLWRIISEANFGTIWARPGLSLRDRELICMSILIAIGAHGVAIHFKHAHNLGFTDDELRELIIQTIPYAGLPKALQAMATFRRVKAGEELKL